MAVNKNKVENNAVFSNFILAFLYWLAYRYNAFNDKSISENDNEGNVKSQFAVGAFLTGKNNLLAKYIFAVENNFVVGSLILSWLK